MAGKSVSYKVVVKTGDKKRAGTDANVRVILHDDKGQKTKAAKLDNFLRDDFERGQIDKFTVKDVVDLDEIHQIELWRDDAGMYSDWFCDYVEVTINKKKQDFIFPIYRWIRPEFHYFIQHLDTFLPKMTPIRTSETWIWRIYDSNTSIPKECPVCRARYVKLLLASSLGNVKRFYLE